MLGTYNGVILQPVFPNRPTCALVGSLFTRRFASRVLGADKSARQIAACKQAFTVTDDDDNRHRDGKITLESNHLQIFLRFATPFVEEIFLNAPILCDNSFLAERRNHRRSKATVKPQNSKLWQKYLVQQCEKKSHWILAENKNHLA